MRRLWEKITEPRHLSLTYGGIYSIVVLVGWVTLLVPPTTIKGELGPLLTSLWAGLFILGGVIGMVAVLPGWWAWERWANLLVLSGIGIYGIVVAALHFQEAGSRLTQLGILLLASTVFIVRWLLIRGRTYGPRVV